MFHRDSIADPGVLIFLSNRTFLHVLLEPFSLNVKLSAEKEYFLADGKRFDPYYLLSSHLTFITQALREGWKGVRISIDMTWLSNDTATPEQILKYEALSDAIFTFQNTPIIGLMYYGILPKLGVRKREGWHTEEQEDSMGKFHPTYTKEFKRQAVNVFETSGKSKAHIFLIREFFFLYPIPFDRLLAGFLL